MVHSKARWLRLGLAGFLLATGVLSAAESVAPDSKQACRTDRLPNGLTVVRFPFAKSKDVRVRLTLDVSGEPDRVALQTLPFTMIHQDKMGYFHERLEKGEQLNVHVDRKLLALTADVAPADLPRALASLALLLNPRTFTQSELAESRRAFRLQITKAMKNEAVSGFAKKLLDRYGEREKNDPLAQLIQKNEFNPEEYKRMVETRFAPANARLMLVGNFDDSAWTEITNSLGIVAPRPGPAYDDAKAKVTEKTTSSVRLAGGRPSITWKKTFEDFTVRDYLILYAYVTRIEDGAEPSLDVVADIIPEPGHTGTMMVTLTSPHARKEADEKAVVALFEKEAVRGEITDEKIKQRLDIMYAQLSRTPTDLPAAIRWANWYDWFQASFRTDARPGDLLREITPTDFREVLKKRLVPQTFSRSVTVPFLYFPGDRQLILWGGFLAVLGSQRIRARRKRPQTPLVSVVGYPFYTWLILIFGSFWLILFSVACYEGLFLVEQRIPALAERTMLLFYLQTPLFFAGFTWVYTHLLAKMPRQLHLSDEGCVLVHFTGRVSEIPFASVEVAEETKNAVVLVLKTGKRRKLRVNRPAETAALINGKLKATSAPAPAPTPDPAPAPAQAA